MKPEVHEVVVSWRAGMFYTHRKLQHKQLAGAAILLQKKIHGGGQVTSLDERG